MSMPTSDRILLAGPDHETAGSIAVEQLGPHAAAGIARGWAPKPYAYLDPNEDMAAVVCGPRGTLLVVADGHSGREAPIAAVEAVLAHIDDDPPAADLSDDELVEVLEVANRAVLRRVMSLEPPRADSRTTLVVALVAGDAVQWAALGDSVAILAAPGRTRLLAAQPTRFVGQPGGVARVATKGSTGAPHGAWVILATDGYSDWAPDGGDLARATALWTAGARDAGTVVHRLLDKARAGGAGDNVAIAVTRVDAR
jgi:serine/threonine protein phosphatase PrpC